MKRIILFILVIAGTHLFAQDITVTGRVTDKNGHNTLMNIMVVNQRSGNGTFASGNGEFTIKGLRTDTIMVTARDFSIKKICFKDSLPKNIYTVWVKLDSLHFELGEVYVHPKHNLPEIHKEISSLGKENTDTYKNVTAMSPITLLYERFSKIERSKRKVAEMEDEEKRRDVLKDLLHLYIKYDIINLDDKSFDDFISYCNLSDDFIKNATDYELIMAIKQRYQGYIRNSGKDYYNGK